MYRPVVIPHAPLSLFQVIFGEDARKKLADGINSVSDAVKVRIRDMRTVYMTVHD